VCTPAIRILEDMGVLKELMDNNEAHFADAGVCARAQQHGEEQGRGHPAALQPPDRRN
jgi:hypothetical protein